MATFNTAFGSLPGYKEMMGTTNSTAGGEEKPPTVYGGQTQTQRKTEQPAQTFAQMQTQGRARPAAPPSPTATAFGQYGGSQQGQQLRGQLQQRLTEFGQAPSRYDTESFKQIRGAQAANLQSEYSAQQKALNEDLARRGLSASSIGGGRMGDLAGQQARALSSLDAQLLQQAADTQAQDRAQYMQSGQGLAELAGSQDLQQFEANRVAQAATFENQLRSAQFGQQQYEQAGQEAFQGAQSEEAASQAARQFDLAALGQTGGLSLDLQRLLGSQETERAGLTGQLGAQQTLAGQQQTEQRRQFDLQQRLQEQIGLGGLGVQQQEVGIKQQALQQQATDAAAERTLRESLQTRELTAQEKQQLADITSRRELQTQQVTEQARQFGLTLTEQQSARNQQLGISNQELALERDRVTNQNAQAGSVLTAQKAQDLAQNNLEQARINEAIASRGTGVSESALERSLRQSLQTQQVSEQGRQFNLEQSLRNAIAQTEATGMAYEPMTTGTGVAALGGMNKTLARTAQEAAQMQATLDTNLRRQLGLTELSGKVYDSGGNYMGSQETVGSRTATAETAQAQNQLFMQLASVLSGLTPAQQAALKGGTYTAPAAPTNGQISGKWKFNAATDEWEPYTGGAIA